MPDRERSPALIGWRLLALLYDLFPVLALWMLLSTAFTFGHTYLGNHPARDNIAPFSVLQWLLWLCCWLATGLYATASWRRGGQTIGMKPWRAYVTTPDDALAPLGRLWLRYATGIVSLVCAGLGFWWAWIDRDGLTWHDRLSGTRFIRDFQRDALQDARKAKPDAN